MPICCPDSRGAEPLNHLSPAVQLLVRRLVKDKQGENDRRSMQDQLSVFYGTPQVKEPKLSWSPFSPAMV